MSQTESREGRSGDRGSDRERGSSAVEEIASKMLRIQNKRYYVDVKQNSRGKFIKLVEVLNNGTRNKINIPMPVVGDIRDRLTSFADFYAQLDPAQTGQVPEEGKLKSETQRSGGRRYYFDLKENQRGRFLRISQLTQFGARATLALPAQGIVDIRNTLSEFLDQHGGDEGASDEEEDGELPQAKEMRIERKRFYFDCGRNNRGSFLRVSEVTSNFRSSITIPRQGLSKFKDILCDLADELNA
ncbi:transcriptional regulator protein Pur-beta-like [Rhopilema esculentum]|uniref:transcriptional regulator protein Pur-beta-like n=1 Tax=Rhopilema esculentum TaxID=499914 RepID=UPI0031D83F82